MDHYICVIDMLGRAGRITDAHNIFPEMTFGPNSVAWMTLLSACLAHENAQVGEIAARELQNLEPDNVTSYVMLASLYGKTGRVEESKKVLSLMKHLPVLPDWKSFVFFSGSHVCSNLNYIRWM